MKVIIYKIINITSPIYVTKFNSLVLSKDLLTKKVRDPDESVRHFVLGKLLDAFFTDPSALSVETVDEIKERVIDKKFEIRKTALIGLCKIYNKYVSSQLPPLPSASSLSDLTKRIPQDTLAKLSNIPELLVKSWGVPEMASKHLILQMLQEQILPKSIKAATVDSQQTNGVATDSETQPSSQSDLKDEDLCDQRASSLLLLLSNLSETDENVLSNILGFKSRLCRELTAFVSVLREKMTTKARPSSLLGISDENRRESDQFESIDALRTCLFRLTQIVPIADKRPSAFDKLLLTK